MKADEDLLDEVTDALERMVKLTCATMLPLWLEASQKVRSKLEGQMPDVPAHLRVRLGDGSRSKYKALACWRHSVVWKELVSGEIPAGVDAAWDDDLSRFDADALCMEAVYFTPCVDETPFSFSQKKFASPLLREDTFSEDEVLRTTNRACWSSLKILEHLWQEEEGGPAAEFLYLGVKYTVLNDVLKFSDMQKKSKAFKTYKWVPPKKRGGWR